MKKSTSFRLSNTARTILAEQSEALGVSQTSVVEILLRQKFGHHEPNIRTKSWLDFQHKHQGQYPSTAQVFHAGFAAGWHAAQREKSHEA